MVPPVAAAVVVIPLTAVVVTVASVTTMGMVTVTVLE
jgi:hypothetical protein